MARFDVEIQKLDEDRRIAFGWASVVARKDGTPIVDSDGHELTAEPLERAVYKYVLESRDADEMHERRGVGRLVESVFLTSEKMEKIGIPEGTVPVGWWVGFKVDDSDVWAKVKDGTYRMFSIFGRGSLREA